MIQAKHCRENINPGMFYFSTQKQCKIKCLVFISLSNDFQNTNYNYFPNWFFKVNYMFLLSLNHLQFFFIPFDYFPTGYSLLMFLYSSTIFMP